MIRNGQLATWLRAGARSEIEIPSTSPAWEQFTEAACGSGLAGLILEAVTRHGIDPPEHVAEKLRHHGTAIAAGNLSRMHELERLLSAFNHAGIPVMLLKGAALNLTVYDRPDLRPMSDLDLLIRPWTVGPAFRLLEDCGYRRGFELMRRDFFPTYHYEVEFLGRSPGYTRIDLHARPFRPLRVSRTMPDDALWHDAEVVRSGEALALIPRPELMFIHLAAHAAFHGCSRLLWLYDLKRLVDRCCDGIDWLLVARSARCWRLSLPVLRAVTRAAELLGPIGPPSLIEELKSHETNWRDRLTLAQAPRDAASPLVHVGVNLLCTPGVRFRMGYLRAVLQPDRQHLSGIYPFRHPGWTWFAQLWRPIRALGRCVSSISQTVKRLMGQKWERRGSDGCL